MVQERVCGEVASGEKVGESEEKREKGEKSRNEVRARKDETFNNTNGER